METSTCSPCQGWKCKRSALGALRGWIKQECITMLKLVLPIFFTQVFTQVIFLVSLIFVGQINGGVLEIDAAGLSVALINVTAMAIILGMGTAVDTLCSQAFGLKNYKRVGIVLQQGIMIIGLSLFPIWALWLNMEPLLLLLGQDSCVVTLAAQYLISFGLALPFVMVYVLVSKYLQAQSIVFVLVAIGFITNCLNVVMSALFIFKLELGFLGAVLGMTLSQSAAPLFLLAYVWSCGLHKQTWGGWSWESLVDWWTFIKLAIPGLLMVGFEWWSYELGIILVGTISNTQLGIYVIVLNVATNIFMVPLAIGGAVAVRVGNELGAGNPQKAKRAIYVAYVITLLEVTALALLLQALKHKIGKFFTSDEAVIKGVTSMMDFLSAFIYADHSQCILGAAIRGSGQQSSGAITNFLSFYVVGQPIGISLALAGGLGALGHWIGLLCGAVLQILCYLFLLVRTDWNQQSLKAMKSAKVDDVRVLFHKEKAGEEESEGQAVPCKCDSEPLSEQDSKAKGEVDISPSKAEGTTVASLNNVEQELNSDLGTEDNTDKDPEDAAALSAESPGHLRRATGMTRAKLLLYRVLFFMLGITILVGGGVSSHFLVAKGSTMEWECQVHNGSAYDSINSTTLSLSLTPTTDVTTPPSVLMNPSMSMALSLHTVPLVTPPPQPQPYPSNPLPSSLNVIFSISPSLSTIPSK